MNRIARRLLTPTRLSRTARGALIAVALALVIAAPAAAAQPTRTVYHGGQPFAIPADKACPFPVEAQPSGGFAAYTVFSDGHLAGGVHLKGDYVNADTGARYPTLDNFHFSQWTYATTGNTYVVLEGQAADSFLPGDTGPFGTVGRAWCVLRLRRKDHLHDRRQRGHHAVLMERHRHEHLRRDLVARLAAGARFRGAGRPPRQFD